MQIQIYTQHSFTYIQENKGSKFTVMQLMELKQKSFQPKLSIFDRYNYQNYQNYNYKNPFVRHKHYTLIKDQNKKTKFQFPKNYKYKLNKGENKNLQIVFCQTKYQEFVEKANQMMQKEKKNLENCSTLQIQSKISNNESQFNKKSLEKNEILNLQSIKRSIIDQQKEIFNSKNITKWNYSKYNSKTLISWNECKNQKNIKNNLGGKQSISKVILSQKGKIRSTLQNYLEQFKNLQKLTELQQGERTRQINKHINSLKINTIDFSKTVSIALIIDKFPFLKSLNKTFRIHLIKILFDINQCYQNAKISIHDYLKFSRIFIARDGPIEQISFFIFKILFRNQTIPSFSMGKNVLQQIRKENKKKLQQVIQILFQILDNVQESIDKVLQKFNKNPIWIHLVIDLILNI